MSIKANINKLDGLTNINKYNMAAKIQIIILKSELCTDMSSLHRLYT